MADQPAGWYPDPKGEATQRYWDGAAWTDHVDGSPPAGFPPPPPAAPSRPPPLAPGYAHPASTYPRAGQAGWALGLSIGGVLCCGPLSVVGLIMGRSEIQAIDRGETDPDQRGMAKSAFIVGIVGVVFLVVQILAIVLIVAASSST